MTPVQCVEARRLLGRKQQRLTARANVSCTAVRAFEADGERSRPQTVELIRGALEDAGVDFVIGDGGAVGARLGRRVLQAA